MNLKTWLLNKLVVYATKEAGKKKMQEMRSRFLNPDSDSSMPGVSFTWTVDEKGNCTCPYHPKKKEKKKNTVRKTQRKTR